MELDPEVDAAYPSAGSARSRSIPATGSSSRAAWTNKGDPGNTLSRAEIEDKTLRLGRYADAATEGELRTLIDTVWSLKRRRPWGSCWVEAGGTAQPERAGLSRTGHASRASPLKG